MCADHNFHRSVPSTLHAKMQDVSPAFSLQGGVCTEESQLPMPLDGTRYWMWLSFVQHCHLPGHWVIWGQCCLRLAAAPGLPNGPIMQLSSYFTPLLLTCDGSSGVTPLGHRSSLYHVHVAHIHTMFEPCYEWWFTIIVIFLVLQFWRTLVKLLTLAVSQQKLKIGNGRNQLFF